MKYEAGVAECYDYEAIGDDPLRNLMRELGLATTPTAQQRDRSERHAPAATTREHRPTLAATIR